MGWEADDVGDKLRVEPVQKQQQRQTGALLPPRENAIHRVRRLGVVNNVHPEMAALIVDTVIAALEER